MGRPDKFRMAEIASKKLAGEITKEEEDVLNRWLATSEYYQNAYDRLNDPGSQKYHEELYQRLISPNVFLSGVNRKLRKRLFIRKILPVISGAAILVAGLFLLIDRNVPGSDIHNYTVNAESHAILSVSTGEQVNLTDSDQGGEWYKRLTDAVSSEEDSDANVMLSLSVSRGNDYKIILDDGTTVWLNSESRLDYPLRFEGKKREVVLEGEAYFEVAQNPEVPFHVKAADTDIIVLGTQFNISAYETQHSVITTLIHGSVEVFTFNGTSAVLSPGEQAVVAHNTDEIQISNVDTSLYSAWTQGLFIFEEMELSDICSQLSRWYDVEFEFEDNTEHRKFSGGARKNVSLGFFLENIEMVTDVSFVSERDRIVVRKNK